MDEYLRILETFGYDIKTQIHFYDAANRKMFYKMFTNDHDKLIGTVTNVSHEVLQLNEISETIRKARFRLEQLLKERAETQAVIDTLRGVLPASQDTWVSDN